MPPSRLSARIAQFLTLALLASGCASRYDPAKAMPPYPIELHGVKTEDAEGYILEQPLTEDMQVFRNGVHIEIFNATPRHYQDFTLWINQQYGRAVDGLAAGGSVRLNLWTFHDEWGDPFNAGGWWRASDSEPVRLVEIQRNDQDPLIGLVTIWQDKGN